MGDFQAGTRAVIFDLDGVIADTEPLHQVAFLRLFKELGISPAGLEPWERFIGTSDRSTMIELVGGLNLGVGIDELLDRKAQLFVEAVRERAPLYPQIPGLVQDLAARYALAVASGSLRSAIHEVLSLSDLRRFFRHAVSVQDVERGKPAPDLFLRAASLLGAGPAACVVLEDSAPGVQAARAAGMRVIGITNTMSRERLAAADQVVGSYDEVRDLLLS